MPSRLVDNLIRYGYGGTETAALFEASVDKFFKLLGYDSNCLGQGHGRVADVIAKYRAAQYAKSYGLIIDAKAYPKYPFPAGDVRKMKEYIELHGAELLADTHFIWSLALSCSVIASLEARSVMRRLNNSCACSSLSARWEWSLPEVSRL